jgi:hypothetical protein
MRMTRKHNNISSDMVLSLSSQQMDYIPSWWYDFAVKISNLVNIMDKTGYNYVFAGSSANALLTYFTEPELLQMLPKPNDGDIIIIPDEYKQRYSFRQLFLYTIGPYRLQKNQYDTDSGTFVFDNVFDSENAFESIDVNIESSVPYIIIDSFKILSPKELLARYFEHKRANKNEPKISVLSKILQKTNSLSNEKKYSAQRQRVYR